jgi:CheY-like chemotaxis protein/nitrogen-specific signal transduction histidine kinase
MVQDITILKLIELDLIEARDQAENASKAKSDFLSSMSHELRTPMNAILGFAQILDFDTSLSEEHRLSVKEILAAGFHLLDLIKELLDLSQIESGQLNLSLESVDVCSVVDESLKLINVLADKRKIKMTHSGLEGVTIKADRIRFKQALLNLLSNAIKYNREGGNIYIEVRPHGPDRLRIMVKDTGVGIPAMRLDEVFQAFNRIGAENGNVMGTGIGLTITRRLIEMMNGSVGCESEEGVGSIFWIELPVEFMPLSAHEVSPRLPSSTEHSQLNAIKYTVLYIEDNPSNLRLVSQLFIQRKHIHFITAHTPELGIDLARAHLPDLILLDINMPGMDGFQVMDVFKLEKSLQDIPVIAVTAAAMQSEIERGLEAGFNEYLTKPLDIANFFSILDRYLPCEVTT